MRTSLENPRADAPEKAASKPSRVSLPIQPWYSPSGFWQRKSTIIAAFSIVAIASYLSLRFGFHATPETCRIPLLATLILGGLPMLYDLLRKLLKLEFGSDLLGGISIITSVLLDQYLAGSVIVLMLAGGEALESYALRSASSVLNAHRAEQRRDCGSGGSCDHGQFAQESG
jgi:cation transport ATPase